MRESVISPGQSLACQPRQDCLLAGDLNQSLVALAQMRLRLGKALQSQQASPEEAARLGRSLLKPFAWADDIE